MHPWLIISKSGLIRKKLYTLVLSNTYLILKSQNEQDNEIRRAYSQWHFKEPQLGTTRHKNLTDID
ncbi:hypothetical protein BpHYR1_033868 [Brachionus plicatilis]|uniref:Uncharacterized protein n=1 Tax=Brachionus plicatilis TaxID=10195 RepID=A0A3M7RVJ1_BRAPC|nr:hypothetical protein BpHYR1_033868 [Brachionus plicatilis]